MDDDAVRPGDQAQFRRGRIRVALTRIHQALELPPDVQILEVVPAEQSVYQEAELLLEGDAIPLAPSHEPAPLLHTTVQTRVRLLYEFKRP